MTLSTGSSSTLFQSVLVFFFSGGEGSVPLFCHDIHSLILSIK